ncbi:MAG: N-6 DNA methylase [Chitinophagaceae bacterium]
MINGSVIYNERSWAIDLIAFLKQLSAQTNLPIKDVGGEQGIRVDGGSLFPDVILFGDKSTARILQGWELKLPDTNIDDVDFRDNAEIKANALGLDSFILWNVAYARLYVRDDTSKFQLLHQWDELSDIKLRTSVGVNRTRWEQLASKIFSYLNDLFSSGKLEGRQFIDAYRSGGVTSLIIGNVDDVEEALRIAEKSDQMLRSEMILWWNNYKREYSGNSMESVLARAIIFNWIGKLLFANILREQDSRAHQVSEINDSTTPKQALEIFRQISENCNFWSIFSNSLGLSHITDTTWGQLKQFNYLLTDLRVGSVDQAQLSNILEATVEVATRKLRGQYPTPFVLARFLAALCIRDIENDRVYDPCCGSGTIARASIELKLSNGISPIDASSTVYASDLDPQAVQIATFALANASMMHIPLRIFRKDAFTLTPELQVEFRNPSDGTLFIKSLDHFDAILSNLPFVAQEGRKQYGNALNDVIQKMEVKSADFSKRADVAAYLPFAFHSLLKNDGRLGIIITNAWLGTDWGDAFFQQLRKHYCLRYIITSGAGRWFQNSEVVTNILIMDKREYTQNAENEELRFVVLTRPIDEISEYEDLQIAVAQIITGQTQSDAMTIKPITVSNLEKYRSLGLAGNAQFVHCEWVLNLKLIPLKNIFKVNRGERRGKNALFYPKRASHSIEQEYIRPLLKSPGDFTHLSTAKFKEAFSCSKTLSELEALGHNGALYWIRKFETEENVKKLTTKNKLWYQMDTDNLTELVMFINYGERLFVGRVDPPAFVDQRMVALTPLRDNVDIGLYHAILNCSILLFFIEGMGFGRGLGALDLNKDRIEDFMHIPDLTNLDESQINRIKEAFLPLLNRPILNIADELESEDRQYFDDTVLEILNIPVTRETIYNSLLALIEIRLTATSA